MSRNSTFFLFLSVAAVILLIATACGGAATTAAPTQPPAATEPPATAAPPTEALSTVPPLVGDSIRGGLLYDKWWVVIGADAPTGDQPLWQTQTTNTRTGPDTWRCKECHGWDYLGKDGRYGSGSHQTGFVGVMGVAGQDPNEILAILQGGANPDHDFSTVMDEQALIDLALFLGDELIDDSAIVNADKTPVGGDASAGDAIWSDNCAECHGPQGLAVNFSDETGPEYVGTIGADNPWEFLHKARFGQPGETMPAGMKLGLSDQDYANLLAYVQSLPTSSPVAEGGRLYDEWWVALGADAPTGDQPLWQTQTTNTRTGPDTWRCKECHGWDYLGKDGRYGSGSHQTGFAGVFAAKDKSADELTAALTGQVNPDHDFSAVLDESQINMLVAFVQQGLTDTSAYINADKTVNGDPAKGKTIYVGTCERCHGEQGKLINFGDEAGPEYVGTIAADNPWEFWHKASFGQPGEPMPAGVNNGWVPQDLADLLAYAQTLPQK